MNTPQDIQARALEFLESEICTDCCFIVGEEPKLMTMKAHKMFLSVATPVFKDMFYGNMPESKTIFVPDVQPDAFKKMLKYIYSCAINLSSNDEAYAVIYAARKYMIPGLAAECFLYMSSNLTPETVCQTYEIAALFDEYRLMRDCLNLMRLETKTILHTLNTASLSSIVTLLDQEQLEIDSELDLLFALEEYAAKQNMNAESTSKGGQRIRDALCKIRFLTLKPEEIDKLSKNSSLITEMEKLAILTNCNELDGLPMPEGFTTVSHKRLRKTDCLTTRYCAWRNKIEDFKTIPPYNLPICNKTDIMYTRGYLQ